jgi:hypothetical protein
MFMAASERRRREILLSDALAMRMAGADKKGWREYTKKLQGR